MDSQIVRQNDNNTQCFTACTSTSSIYLLINEFVHKIILTKQRKYGSKVMHQNVSSVDLMRNHK